MTECDQTGALGAAIGVGIATGVFDDYEAGVTAMTRISRVLEPAKAMRSHYDARYRTYLSLVETMRDFWMAQRHVASANSISGEPEFEMGSP